MPSRRGPLCAWLPAVLAAVGAPLASSCPEAPQWLYDRQQDVPGGYHVVCIDDDGSTEGLRVRLWVDGHIEADPKLARWSVAEKSSLQALRKQLRKLAAMPKNDVWTVLSWALFDTAGGRVRQPSQARGLLLAFEGGRWMWPGIRVGYERPIAVPIEPGTEPRTLLLRTVSVRPGAFIVDGILEDPSLAEYVLEKAQANLANNHKVNKAKNEEHERAWVFVPHQGDKKLMYFRRLSAHVYRIPERLQEPFEVLEYKEGQSFDSHVDYYDVVQLANTPMSPFLKHGANRYVTGLWFISEPEGGETYFPGPSVNETKDFKTCSGESVKPRWGSFLFWYSLLPNANIDTMSWHGGCAVKEGVKHVVYSCAWNFGTPNTPRVSEQADEPDAIDYGGGGSGSTGSDEL